MHRRPSPLCRPSGSRLLRAACIRLSSALLLFAVKALEALLAPVVLRACWGLSLTAHTFGSYWLYIPPAFGLSHPPGTSAQQETPELCHLVSLSSGSVMAADRRGCFSRL